MTFDQYFNEQMSLLRPEFESRLVYVAGPYAGDIDLNLERVREMSVMLLGMGYMPVAPHFNLGVLFNERERGHRGRDGALAAGIDLAREIARAGGLMVAIMPPETQKPSHGTLVEVTMWQTYTSSMPLQVLPEQTYIASRAVCGLCGGAGVIPCHPHAISFVHIHGKGTVSKCRCGRTPAVSFCPACSNGQWPIPFTTTTW